jgi:hypothetical protein
MELAGAEAKGAVGRGPELAGRRGLVPWQLEVGKAGVYIIYIMRNAILYAPALSG